MMMTRLTTRASTGRRMKRSVMFIGRIRLPGFEFRAISSHDAVVNNSSFPRKWESRDRNLLEKTGFPPYQVRGRLRTSTGMTDNCCSCLFLLESVILRRWRFPEVGGQRIVDHHRLTVTQFENAGADHRFSFLQPAHHGHVVAALGPQAHELLTQHFSLFIRCILDNEDRVTIGSIQHGRCRNGKHRLLYAPYGDSVFIIEDAADKKGKV